MSTNPTVVSRMSVHMQLLVFWSADTIHGTENNNTGDVDTCVFYIPAVPTTPNNVVSVKSHTILDRVADIPRPSSNTSLSNEMPSSTVCLLPTSQEELESLNSRTEQHQKTFRVRLANLPWGLSHWRPPRERLPRASTVS